MFGFVSKKKYKELEAKCQDLHKQVNSSESEKEKIAAELTVREEQLSCISKAYAEEAMFITKLSQISKMDFAYLYENGAREIIEALKEWSYTPIHDISSFSRETIANLFVTHGADLDGDVVMLKKTLADDSHVAKLNDIDTSKCGGLYDIIAY